MVSFSSEIFRTPIMIIIHIQKPGIRATDPGLFHLWVGISASIPQARHNGYDFLFQEYDLISCTKTAIGMKIIAAIMNSRNILLAPFLLVVTV